MDTTNTSAFHNQNSLKYSAFSIFEPGSSGHKNLSKIVDLLNANSFSGSNYSLENVFLGSAWHWPYTTVVCRQGKGDAAPRVVLGPEEQVVAVFGNEQEISELADSLLCPIGW